MNDGTLNLPDEPNESDQSVPQRYIGNYQILRLIGSGAMGEVYQARHRRFVQREYAIKLLRQEISTAEALRRFEREIDAMGGLHHPNLVYALDAGVDHDQMYLVMEFVRGQDLQSHLDTKGTFKPGQAAEILRQISAGVAYAHQKGVVHRDIKPANVLLSSKMEVKVLDLGIASLQNEAGSRMTQGGTIMGTAPFIAPELWDDAMNASPASDVYAIGCTAYCLMLGSPPFAGNAYATLVQMMHAHRQVDPTPLHVLREEVPEELSRLLMRSLSKEPHQRFHDAAELVEELQPFCEELTTSDSLASDEAPARSQAWTDSQVRTSNRSRRELESLVANSLSLAWLVFPTLFVAIALLSVFAASLGDFSTEAWDTFFSRYESPSQLASGTITEPALGEPDDALRLGLIADAVRALLLIPIAWLVLSRYYPAEVRRISTPTNWQASVTLSRILLAAVFGVLSYQVFDYFWQLEQLPTLLSEQATSEVAGSDAEQVTGAVAQSVPSRTYFGYAWVTRALLTTATIAFPLIWFVFGDIASIRRRFGELISQVVGTSYPGRMRENLHRYGNDLRERTGRIIAVFFVAVIHLQFDYWLNLFSYSRTEQELQLVPLLWRVIATAIAFPCVVIFVALMYSRGYEITSRQMAACGSAKDIEDLSVIGPGWLLKTTLLHRLSGIGCLSLLVILGHMLWEANQGEQPKPIPDNGSDERSLTETITWLPLRCVPGPDAQQVNINFRGAKARLYSVILLQPAFSDAPQDRIEMVLVPQINSQHPPHFYIMRSMVSASLFAKFEAKYPNQIDAEAAARRHEQTLSPEQPVYNVTGQEAFSFAEAAGVAKLPSPQQWDAAFGRYFSESDVRSTVQTENPFAMIRDQASPFDCLGMGILGLEFTRYDPQWERLIPHSETPHSLQLRGRSQFSDEGPLQIQQWQDAGLPDRLFFGARPLDAPSDEISFRIVIDQDG